MIVIIESGHFVIVTDCPDPSVSQNSLADLRGNFLEGAVAHAACGRDGRQEGRERGYYHLHPNLNDFLLHDY